MTPAEYEAMKKSSAEARGHKGELVESNTEVPLLAFGIFKDVTNGEWCVAKISYDPATNEAVMVEKISTGGFRGMANEKFKIEVARTLQI